jgi:MFS family permease
MGLAMSGLTATLFVQLASLAGAPAGGWLADWWRRRSPGGRAAVQAIGMFAGAPFVALCGMTASVTTLVVALTCWGFFKGLYDANIFASAFDLVPAEARGRTAGMMNLIGWLAGGGSAPVVIGLVAERSSLGTAMALSSLVYVAAGLLLVLAAFSVPVNPSSRAT